MTGPLLGGVLIGLASAGMWLLCGRITGISGIVGELLARREGEVGWRVAFIGGLGLAGWLGAIFAPSQIGEAPVGAIGLLFAGLLVGFGTRLGNGCTSGHGVCGIPRGSSRSLVATGTFMVAGIVTVWLT